MRRRGERREGEGGSGEGCRLWRLSCAEVVVLLLVGVGAGRFETAVGFSKSSCSVYVSEKGVAMLVVS